MASSTTAAPSTSTFPVPQDFIGWIEAHGHELKPPVGNKLMYGAGQMKVMIVAGPNDRNDFHIEEGEEMFFMVKGNMQLNIIERGEFKEIPIKEGQIFMLPKHIPHSPQRGAGSIGLVLERERRTKEMDAMRWYTPGQYKEILHEEWFHCTDLGKDLGPVMKNYKDSEACKTGKPTRTFTDQPFELDTTTVVPDPLDLDTYCAANAGKNTVLYDKEFTVAVMQASEVWPCWQVHEGETFMWQRTGDITIDFKDGAAAASTTVKAGQVIVVPRGVHFRVKRPSGTAGIVVTNQAVAAPAAVTTGAVASGDDAAAGSGAGGGAGAA